MASILLLKKCQNRWVYDPDGVLFELYVLFQYQFLTGVVLVFQRGEVLFKSGVVLTQIRYQTSNCTHYTHQTQ